MSSSRLGVLVLALILLTATLLGGCESTHQYLLAKGYPPAYADGFDDGCGSGRQAAGSISGEFRKDVPRYLREAIYASGWATASSNAGRWRGAKSGGVSRSASGRPRRRSAARPRPRVGPGLARALKHAATTIRSTDPGALDPRQAEQRAAGLSSQDRL